MVENGRAGSSIPGSPQFKGKIAEDCLTEKLNKKVNIKKFYRS